MKMQFEWDSEKDLLNQGTHGVSFDVRRGVTHVD
jgi:uncharacterized DUF497 family protein